MFCQHTREEDGSLDAPTHAALRTRSAATRSDGKMENRVGLQSMSKQAVLIDGIAGIAAPAPG